MDITTINISLLLLISTLYTVVNLFQKRRDLSKDNKNSEIKHRLKAEDDAYIPDEVMKFRRQYRLSRDEITDLVECDESSCHQREYKLLPSESTVLQGVEGWGGVAFTTV